MGLDSRTCDGRSEKRAATGKENLAVRSDDEFRAMKRERRAYPIERMAARSDVAVVEGCTSDIVRSAGLMSIVAARSLAV